MNQLNSETACEVHSVCLAASRAPPKLWKPSDHWRSRRPYVVLDRGWRTPSWVTPNHPSCPGERCSNQGRPPRNTWTAGCGHVQNMAEEPTTNGNVGSMLNINVGSMLYPCWINVGHLWTFDLCAGLYPWDLSGLHKDLT